MSNINALSQASIPVFNVQVPVEGPCAIPLQLDFSVSTTYFVDGRGITDRPGYFSMIQTLWIDTTNASGNVSVLIGGINQLITAKQGTQGYYPVLCPNSFHLTITCSGSTGLVNVDLINVPIAPGVWPPSTGGGGSGTVTSVGLSSTDLAVSGSPVTTAGTITANLNTTAVTPGTYGDATHVGQFTVDSKGRLTTASNVAISGGGSGDWKLLTSLTASASASLNFPTVFSSNPSYKRFVIVVDNYVPSVNGQGIFMLMSTDGVTFDGGSHYSWIANRQSIGGAAAAGSASTTSFDLAASGGNSSTALQGGGCHEVWVHQPANGSFHPRIDWRGGNNDGTGNPDVLVIGCGSYLVTTACTGFQVKVTSGNITSGIVSVYGVS